MVKKYLFKSHGKFRLALIDIDSNGTITGRSIPVNLYFWIIFLGLKSSISFPDVQILDNIRASRSPNQAINKRLD